MNLNLFQEERQLKAPLTVYLYTTTMERLELVAKMERIKLSHLLRSLINNFLAEYEADYEQKKKG